MSGNKSKVAIVGAGFVGASAAFALAMKQLVNEMVIIDVDRAKAAGEALDINHGLPFIGQMDIYDGDYSDCANCDAIIITAGINRRPGESRIDLAKKNVIIAKDVTENIMKYYTGGVILVVSNPVDILTYKIQKWSGLPNGRVLGTGTVLDSSRFRYLLSEKLDVDVKNVHGYIVGEHGDTQLPLWSATHIAGKNIREYFDDPAYGLTENCRLDIMENVKTAGGKIIRKKGATYYAIAVSVITLLESLLKNQNTIRTVSSVIDKKFGVGDVALSLPSILNSHGVKRVMDLSMTDDELALLHHSSEKLREILKEVDNL